MIFRMVMESSAVTWNATFRLLRDRKWELAKVHLGAMSLFPSWKEDKQIQRVGFNTLHQWYYFQMDRQTGLSHCAPKCFESPLPVKQRTSIWKSSEKVYSWAMHPINNRFRKFLYSHTYCLANSSTRYDDQDANNIAERANCLQSPNEINIIDPHVSTSITSFLSAFNLECHTNLINEDASMWFFQLF